MTVDLFYNFVVEQVCEFQTVQIAQFETRISRYPVLKRKFPNWFIIAPTAKNYKRRCLQRPQFEFGIRQTNESYLGDVD